MTRRVISSGTGSDGSATTPENQTSHGRTIQSRKHSDAGKQVQPKGRSVAGGAGRASSSGKKTQENTVESGNKGSVSRSRSGDFVDARNLAGEDFVSKTLEETIGTLGVVTRPKVVDFSARLKERRKANARVVAMRACVSAAVIVVAGALVWLFFFSSVFRLESGNISVVTTESRGDYPAEATDNGHRVDGWFVPLRKQHTVRLSIFGAQYKHR